MSESASEHRRLSESDSRRVQLVFSDLREFHDGYIHSEQLVRFNAPSHALQRFMCAALAARLDGFYQNRQDGLLAVLRLVNCPLVGNIEAALDTDIRGKSFGQRLNDYRDKNIAHPQFRADHLRKYLTQSQTLDLSADEVEDMKRADQELRQMTAGAYDWLEREYPQLRAADDGVVASVESPKAT